MNPERGRVLYFDNAATSWPKPPAVAESIARFLTEDAANPGRSAHRMAVSASRMIERTRTGLARLVNSERVERMIFTPSATDALNTTIKGVVRARAMRNGSVGKPHVVSTVMEHNSARRPLNELKQAGAIDLTLVACDGEGFVDPEDVLKATNERTCLVEAMHGSNVIGTIQPIGEIGALLRAKRPDALFLVDASQTIGAAPIDVQAMRVDVLAFTGHKSLLGPTGIGGMYVGPRAYEPGDERPRMVNFRQGGTGGDSLSPTNPRELPHYFECGTPNTVGMAGLLGGLENIPADALERERRHVARLIEAFGEMRGVRVVGPKSTERRTAALSVVVEGFSPPELGAALDESFGVAARPGLHCAPGAHEAMGTAPEGTIRFSPGVYTTDEEVEELVRAIDAVVRG